MTTHFDAVITYHTNIHTCGVARFNHYLAQHLEVPLLTITNSEIAAFSRPLVSLKFSEIDSSRISEVSTCIEKLESYHLIAHDYLNSEFASSIVRRAARVMGLNSEIVEHLQAVRPDAVSGFTVASYEIPSASDEPEIRLITFGMAHKIQPSGYLRVAELLKSDPRSHLLEISSALHEGTSFDDSYFEVGEVISDCFRGRVRFLGFLADPEVSLRVSKASAMLAFFPSGARENNNSVVSAMHLSIPVITNLDERSPDWLRHGVTVFDVNRLQVFPSNDALRDVGKEGRLAVKNLTYSNLIRRLL